MGLLPLPNSAQPAASLIDIGEVAYVHWLTLCCAKKHLESNVYCSQNTSLAWSPSASLAGLLVQVTDVLKPKKFGTDPSLLRSICLLFF